MIGAGRRAARCCPPARIAAAVLAVLTAAAIGPVPSTHGTPDWLEVTGPDGTALAGLALPVDAGVCLHWHHSVTGGRVEDCFANRAGVLTLESSFLHDYAAGLGDLPGRGVLRALPGGGYLIENMAEPLTGNRLHLRIASAAVGQELRGDFGWWPLWRLAERGQRVTLALVVHTDVRATNNPRP